MKINRDTLLQKILSFCVEESGVIIGKPGVGKSYLLRELRKLLFAQNTVSFIVKIDAIFSASDNEITEELGLEEDWISTLKELPIENNQKAILIFDAFDAARDEAKREEFLRQIRKAKRELANTCNILVSVRTYDAFKSPQLIKLFPSNKNEFNSLNCRKLAIEELTNEEIVDSIKDNNRLLIFYQESSLELREILRTPFFLTLLEEIINRSSASELESVKKYKSENQLLNFYWEKKIINTNKYILKEQFLSKFTKDLISRRSLNIRKSDLFDLFLVFPQEEFDYLRSENIIDEVSNVRLIFSHNIFFDYAVSVYAIPIEYEDVIKFIEEDKTRPFFLRPSFIYFFTMLWYDDRENFWSFYFHFSREQAKELQLLVRLILNGVIVSEYSGVEELNAIIQYEPEKQKAILIRNILQSIRFSRAKLNHNDIELLLTLSKNLNGSDIYIFDFAFLLERAVDGGKEATDRERCGIAARTLLDYILTKRNSGNKYLLDRIGSNRAVELVAKTYSTDKNESSRILSQIFGMLSEPNFEIHYFSQLSDCVKFFVEDDPDFVGQVYKIIFNHHESSQEQTQMSASVLMNFISNRRQDFELNYFRLEQFFPTFLSASPFVAIAIGLEIVNSDLRKEMESRSNPQLETFLYNESMLEYIPDLSFIWSASGYTTSHGSAKLATEIIKFLDDLISQSKDYSELVLAYIKNAKAAFTWKELLKLSIKYPSELKSLVYPLLVNPVFLQYPDTRYETTELIQKLIGILNDEEIENIEKAIFLIYDESKDNLLTSALSSIPFGKLQLERSRAFMQNKKPIQNEPDFTTSFSSGAFTTDMWLEERGVDFNNIDNKELVTLSNNLEAFNREFLNGAPQVDQYEEPLITAKELYSKLHSLEQENIQEDLYYSVLREISQTLAIISRNLNDISGEDYKFIRSVLIESFLFKSKYENDENSSAQFGWSPTPRVNASEAIFNLYKKDEDSQCFKLYLQALDDNSAIIRYHSSKSLIELSKINYNEYWKLLIDRFKAENDSFVYASLLNNIKFELDKLRDQAKEILDIISAKSEYVKGEPFIENYASVLIWLLRAHKNEDAKTTLLQAYKNVRLCNTIIFKFFESLHPSYPTNNFIEHAEQFQPMIEIIGHYVDECFSELKNIDEQDFSFENERIKNNLSIINEIIVRVFFQLDEARVGRQNLRLPINEDNRRAFYFLIKPLYLKIIVLSSEIKGTGLITGGTAHYFIQSLNKVLSYDPKDILKMISTITKLAASTGYTFDSLAIREMVNITEKLFADHRDLLLQDDSFTNLIDLLDLYINSGWTEALELLWKLDEVFR